jgi:hypothetical protein
MSKREIYDLISKFSVFFVPVPSIEKIKAYTEALSLDNFTSEQVNFVLNNCARKSKFFPSLSDFYETFSPQDSEIDQANEMAGKIISCISLFGPMRRGDVFDYVGEEGWRVIENYGGWTSLCEITNDQVPTVRAHLRDLAKSKIKKYQVDKNLRTIESNNDTKRLGSLYDSE